MAARITDEAGALDDGPVGCRLSTHEQGSAASSWFEVVALVQFSRFPQVWLPNS